MKVKISKKYILISVALSFIISLTINIPVIFETSWGTWVVQIGEAEKIFVRGTILFETISLFSISLIIYILNFYIIEPYNSKLRLSYKSISKSLFINLIFSFILVKITILARNVLGFEVTSLGDNRVFPSKIFYSILISYASIYIIRITFQTQAIRLENEKLRSESLQSQFESLKNQVSPHFLFNSLTALKTLIDESPKNAGKYVSHLSNVLRYTLQSNDKKTVTLIEEVESSKSYLYLLTMRYEKNLIIESNIKKEFNYCKLPPLTIQMLVENAVKHNEISNKHPLIIRIETNDKPELMVSNTIQEKLTPETGTGIGLTNLSKQIVLLEKKEITITKENNTFKVIVPLIEEFSNESNTN